MKQLDDMMSVRYDSKHYVVSHAGTTFIGSNAEDVAAYVACKLDRLAAEETERQAEKPRRMIITTEPLLPIPDDDRTIFASHIGDYVNWIAPQSLYNNPLLPTHDNSRSTN